MLPQAQTVAAVKRASITRCRPYHLPTSQPRQATPTSQAANATAASRDPGYQHWELPVILMTAFGYDPDHSIVKARKKGLEVVLFKPFKVTVLRREIRKALLAGQRARADREA